MTKNSTRRRREQRKKPFADARTQRALASRMLLHSVSFMVAGGLLAAFNQYLSSSAHDRTDLWQTVVSNFYSYALGFILLLPIMVIDSLMLTNRIVGPICRLRSTIRGLARNEAVPPLKFRSGDYWQDIPPDFNKVMSRLSSEQMAQHSANLEVVSSA